MSDVADDYAYRRFTTFGRGEEPLACPNPLLEKSVRGVGQQLGDHFLLAQWGQRQLAKFWRQKRPDELTDEIAHPLGKYAWLADQPPDWSHHIQQTLAALGDVSRVASAGSCRLLITTCPTPWQVSATASSGKGVRAAAGIPSDTVFNSPLPFRLLAEAAQKRGLPLCDVSGEFRQQPNPDRLFLKNAPRLSPQGHELYAAIVARFLTANTFTAPPPTANGSGLQPSELR